MTLAREDVAQIRAMIDFARAGKRYQYADIRAGVLRQLLCAVPAQHEVEMRLDDLEKLIECAERADTGGVGLPVTDPTEDTLPASSGGAESE